MAPQVLANGTVLLDEEVRQSAEDFITESHDRDIARVSITLEDGATLDLDETLSELVQFFLRNLPTGSMNVQRVPEELTTTSAAGILGVSRPTLMKMVKEGKLSSHLVGSHHRFKHSDVSALNTARRAERAEAFARLREIDESLEE